MNYEVIQDNQYRSDEGALAFSTRQYESWRNFLNIVRRDLECDRKSLSEMQAGGGETAGFEYLVESGERLVAYATERLEAAKKSVASHAGLTYVPKHIC